MSISITIHAESGMEALEKMRQLLGVGYVAPSEVAEKAAAASNYAINDALSTGLGVTLTEENGDVERIDPEAFRLPTEKTASEAAGQDAAQETASEAAEQAEPLDTRPLGAPAEGNKRRNSTEKADDDRIEALALKKGISFDLMNKAIAEAGRAEAVRQLEAREDADEKPSISTGEERVGPEDSEADARRDAADEAAETEANGGLAPVDELRRLVGQYQKKHGMPAAVALCAEGGLIGCGVHEVPEADIPAVIEKVRAAIDGETSKGTEAPAEPAKQATKADLQKAMLRYAKKFDGQDTDMNAMPATMEDCPKIFEMLFGEGVTKLSQVPEDGYAKAIAGIDEAIEKNPFKR